MRINLKMASIIKNELETLFHIDGLNVIANTDCTVLYIKLLLQNDTLINLTLDIPVEYPKYPPVVLCDDYRHENIVDGIVTLPIFDDWNEQLRIIDVLKSFVNFF